MRACERATHTDSQKGGVWMREGEGAQPTRETKSVVTAGFGRHSKKNGIR